MEIVNGGVRFRIEIQGDTEPPYYKATWECLKCGKTGAMGGIVQETVEASVLANANVQTSLHLQGGHAEPPAN